MAASLKPYALTSLANLKEAAGITTSADDNLLVRQINAASARIAAYCSRRFYFGALTENLPGFGGPNLRLSLRPIFTTPSTVTLDGGVSFLASTDFGLADKEAGFLVRFASSQGGLLSWPWTAQLRPDIAQDMMPGTERSDLIQVGYVGGYLTQPQYDATPAWTSGAKTLGTIVKDSGSPYGVWAVVTAGTTAGSQPTWPASAARTAGVTVVVDGTVTWMFVDQQPTLPDDLDQACSDLANGYYVRRGADLEVSTESLGDASYTYGGDRGDMPEGVVETLNSYRLAL